MTRSVSIDIQLKQSGEDVQTGNLEDVDNVERVVLQYIWKAHSVAIEMHKRYQFRLDLDDLRQEVMLALVNAYHKCHNREVFTSYAIKCMYGRARDYARSQLGSHGIGKCSYKMAPHVDIDDCYDLPGFVDTVDVCAAREMIAMIDMLPDRARQIIWAAHVDERNYKDIGAELGYADGSSPRQLKKRAVDKIKELL